MTSRPIKNLMDAEKKIYQAGPHWIVFATTASWLLLLILTFIFGPGLPLGNLLIKHTPAYLMLIYILLIFFVITLIYNYLIYITSTYTVTNKRVTIRVGILTRNSFEILLERIESIHVHQSMIGQLFNYGTVTISGTGGNKNFFKAIADPDSFRYLIQQQLERNRSKKQPID